MAEEEQKQEKKEKKVEISLIEKILVPGALIKSSEIKWKFRSRKGAKNVANYVIDTATSVALDLAKTAAWTAPLYLFVRHYFIQ